MVTFNTNTIKIIGKIFRLFFLFSFLTGACALGFFFALFHYRWIDVSVLELYTPGQPSIVLDDAGVVLFRFQLDRREPITLDRMPSHVINAFIAAEDWHFFTHRGISYKGIIRSLCVNIYHQRIVQGASTITQQLVKLLFFDAQKTFSRKIKEQLYALVIEHQFTKEQILETYLNHIYFGCGIYGVEAASQRFWGKHVYELSIDQAATLAAVVRSPAWYCPLLCPRSCQKRRNIILHSMMHLGFITRDTYNQACEVHLTVREEDDGMRGAFHIKEMLRQRLEDMFGKKMVYGGGLIIQTTINKRMQEEAEHIFCAQCIKIRKHLQLDVDGALIAMDSKSGGIKALVGGLNFAQSQFNRATQAQRQMGSIFKPLIYAAALERGMSFTDTEIDEPIALTYNNTTWTPHNYDGEFNGQMTLAYALSHSNNIVPIKLLLTIGAHTVVALAKKCRLRSPLLPYPSLALGCVEATLWQAIGMFNIFANNGAYVEPHYISWIKDQWGKKIWRSEPEQEQVLSTRINSQIAKVLSLGLQRMQKAMPEQWIRSEAISKTGTTNDWRTCWFVGATPQLTTAVYIGCDDNCSLGHDVYPIKTAFPIWLQFNRAIEQKKQTFVYDASLREVIINECTGQLAWNNRDPGLITILV